MATTAMLRLLLRQQLRQFCLFHAAAFFSEGTSSSAEIGVFSAGLVFLRGFVDRILRMAVWRVDF